MTVSSYAKKLDLSHTAVFKAIKTGKIKKGYNPETKKIIPGEANREWGDQASMLRPKAGISKMAYAKKIGAAEKANLEKRAGTVKANFIIAGEEPFIIPPERVGHIPLHQLQVLTDFTGAACRFYEIEFDDLLLPDDDDLDLIVRQQVLFYMLVEGAKMSSADVAKVFDWKEKTIAGYVAALRRPGLQKSLSCHFAGALSELSEYYFTFRITCNQSN